MNDHHWLLIVAKIQISKFLSVSFSNLHVNLKTSPHLNQVSIDLLNTPIIEYLAVTQIKLSALDKPNSVKPQKKIQFALKFVLFLYFYMIYPLCYCQIWLVIKRNCVWLVKHVYEPLSFYSYLHLSCFSYAKQISFLLPKKNCYAN